MDEPNVRQMTAVANWILLGERSSQWSDEQVELLEAFMAETNGAFPQELQRKLIIAKQLNDILRRNERWEQSRVVDKFVRDWISQPEETRPVLSPEFRRILQAKGRIMDWPIRNDAWAFVEGMRVLIEANTHAGEVNEPQLLDDMKFFMIDQDNKFGLSFLIATLSEFGPSNTAYNLYGGPRIGTIGWQREYWDHGQQFKENGDLINQVHHFAAFFVYTFHNNSADALEKAELLDGPDSYFQENPEDFALSKLGISLAADLQEGNLLWEHLPIVLYHNLKSKY